MKDNVLVFRTASFGAEGRSVLHSGIYNREMASSLAAGAVIVLIGLLSAGRFRIGITLFIAAVVFFAALFIIFRVYVFHEPMMKAVFDCNKGSIMLSRKKVVGSEVRSYSLKDLGAIRLGRVTVQPQNVDGIKVVEKIALQHGTVIPGFGKTENFYRVQLDFRGDNVTIFSTKDRRTAEEAADALKNHLNVESVRSEA